MDSSSKQSTVYATDGNGTIEGCIPFINPKTNQLHAEG